jgi:hypothetical protein
MPEMKLISWERTRLEFLFKIKILLILDWLSFTEDKHNSFNKLRTSSASIQAPSIGYEPSGTIIYGGTSTVPEDKDWKLEIYYTKPTNSRYVWNCWLCIGYREVPCCNKVKSD